MNESRRDFLKSTVFGTVSALTLSNMLEKALAQCTAKKDGFIRAESNQVEWRGLFGDAYRRSVERLSKEPLDTVDFILADVNFNQQRRFTNYSGDISGRFIETASLTSTKDNPYPETLMPVIEQILAYQKEDGHYGAPVDWTKTVDIAAATDQSLEMPILWGNGRLMLGLLAAWERFGIEPALESAEKMGDFYINIVVPRFCDPNRMDEYCHEAAGYAAAYVTCVFHGMEGLVRLWRLTGKKKYLDAAVTMADFHEQFDTLPVGHSHGSISAHEALMMLYEETGDEKYLNRVVSRWEKAVAEGYVNPCGGVAEQYKIAYGTDEGCSEADMLRLELMLWRDTKNTRYLDFAERLLFNGYLANQFPSGGFGHRYLGYDDKGIFSWLDKAAESFWCCSFHGPLGYYELKECLAAGSEADGKKTIYYNFPLDYAAPVQFSDAVWTLDSAPLDEQTGVPVRTRVRLSSDAGGTAVLAIRVPDWAEEISVSAEGKSIAGTIADGYWVGNEPFAAGTELEVAFKTVPFLEDRRFNRLAIPESFPAEMGEAVLHYGPSIYVSHEGDLKTITSKTFKADGGAVEIPAEMTCMAKMTAEEREAPSTFVFKTTLVK